MFDVRDRPQKVERALLIGVYFDKREEEEHASLLEELQELVRTLRIGVVASELVFSRGATARYLMTSGKAAELMDLAKERNCDCLIFDPELSPAQQRAWEEDSQLCVIDRQEVILDIFAERAQTKEAVLQVDLARMEYSLPRMARMWQHLDRQGGGSSGATRGEGEKQIEVDRRLARKRIDRVKTELEQVRKQRATQRKERQKTPTPHAAIVGYTNAGKSSLLNALAQSSVLAEDMLFATLDTTTRRIELPDGQPLLLTDTVGFVRNLPHRLVEAFKATLEEAVLADFLVHVLDASDARVREFHETTLEVLAGLGAGEKPIVTVLNKVDRLRSAQERAALENEFPEALFLSAKTGEGLDLLHHKLNEHLLDRVERRLYRIPLARADRISLLHREAKVLSEAYQGNDALVTAIVPKRLLGKVEEFAVPFSQAETPSEIVRDLP
ncbi:MAG: GTPase HflX [Verrucomicrobiota bacterium]